MTQVIKIKRSTSTQAPTSLENGELAYSAISGKLFVGRPGGTTGDVDAIGGKHYTDIIENNQSNWNSAYSNAISSITFDSGSGIFTATRPDSSTITADLDGRYLQSYAETDTLTSVTTRGNTTSNAIEVGGLTVNGNLTVTGTTTTVNTEEINLADNFLLLNSNFTGVASEDAGIEVERGDDANVQIRYNETLNQWEFTNDGTNYSAFGVSSISQENVEDFAGGLITAGTNTNITVTYDDENNRINHSVATATASTLGVASFATPEFLVNSGAVSIVALDGGTF